jgi:hypothetical protein
VPTKIILVVAPINALLNYVLGNSLVCVLRFKRKLRQPSSVGS